MVQPFVLTFKFSDYLYSTNIIMQVNTEQTNTQKMLEHNRMKERTVQGSLQRKMTNVVVGNIDFSESTILNCQDYDRDKLESLFSDGGSVVSDADHQLLVKIKFREKVDCSQITFSPVESNKPRIVKLYVNKNEIDFGDVEAIAHSAIVEIPFDQETPFTVSLAGSKFTRIQSIQLFVEDNYGTDQTCLGPLKIDGFISPSYHTQ
jgi:hypothetical protein